MRKAEAEALLAKLADLEARVSELSQKLDRLTELIFDTQAIALNAQE